MATAIAWTYYFMGIIGRPDFATYFGIIMGVLLIIIVTYLFKIVLMGKNH